VTQERQQKLVPVIAFAGEGLGLRYGTVRLVRAEGRWAAIATQLAADIRGVVSDWVEAVEHVGSCAVPITLRSRSSIWQSAFALEQRSTGSLTECLASAGCSAVTRATTDDGSS
jgi:GrpB-like predicted nucleotidyltransferase (UPF0157 family)